MKKDKKMPCDEISMALFVDEENMTLFEAQTDQIKKMKELGFDMSRAFFIPEDFKNRFRALSLVLKQMLDISNMGEKLKINEELTIELKRITQSLCYLINSNSVREGEYKEYDKQTINTRLGRKK